MQQFKAFLLQYSTWIKYGLIVTNFLVMIIAIKVFINYTTITENIQEVEQQQQRVEDQIAFVEKFQLKYLDSDHAQYFLYHENTLLFPGEKIIAFEKEVPIESIEKSIDPLKLSPAESRQRYWLQKKQANSSKSED